MAQKKKNTRKNSGAKRSVARGSASRPLTKEQQSAKQQVNALILLAVSILVFCLAVIQGEVVWTWLHNFILGLFSYGACVVPVLLAFVAVMLALEKDAVGLKTRVWQSGVFALLFNGTV